MSLPLVSICCQTFNHKNYIEKSISGFLMQQTNFTFEILLRDDASTDGTQEIVKKFADKYPEKIKALIYSENQFKKGVKPFPDNLKRVRGKYIAICEGDDYWIDPFKLQKQVDFLENNTEYSLCFTQRKEYNQNTGKFYIANEIKTDDFSLIDFLDKKKNKIYTANCTSMFRSAIFKKIDFNRMIKSISYIAAGDSFIQAILLTTGRGKILHDITAVYRVTNKGTSSRFDKYSWYKIRMTTLRFLLDEDLINDEEVLKDVKKKLLKIRSDYYKSKIKNKLSQFGINYNN